MTRGRIPVIGHRTSQPIHILANRTRPHGLVVRMLVIALIANTAFATMGAATASTTVASLAQPALANPVVIDFPAVDPSLRRYPYLTDLVDGFATLNWATDQSLSTGSATWGAVATDGSCTPTDTVTASRISISVNSVPEYQWKANLSLAANTQYCYRVFLDTTDLIGSNASPRFWTQIPAGSSQPYSFLVFGDWGEVDSSGNNVDQANLMQQMAVTGARFAVTTGDNAYPDGSQTNFGDLVQKGPSLSAVFGPDFWPSVGDSMAIFTAMGNHGYNRSDTPNPHFANFPQDRAVASSKGRYTRDIYCCTNGASPASYPSTWYAFSVGNARFYVLDAVWGSGDLESTESYKNDYDYHWAPDTPQYQWLENDLATHSEPVKFTFFHFPMYSDNAAEGANTFLQGPNSVEGLLGLRGVDIAFTGHSHMYQRNRANADGLMTYVTGGGGANLQQIGANGCSASDAYGIGWSYPDNLGSRCGAAPVPSSIDRVFHFLKVTVSGGQVTVAPTDSRGRTFDVQTYFFGDRAIAVPLPRQPV
jgi:hypothetical protein